MFFGVKAARSKVKEVPHFTGGCSVIGRLSPVGVQELGGEILLVSLVGAD